MANDVRFYSQKEQFLITENKNQGWKKCGTWEPGSREMKCSQREITEKSVICPGAQREIGGSGIAVPGK